MFWQSSCPQCSRDRERVEPEWKQQQGQLHHRSSLWPVTCDLGAPHPPQRTQVTRNDSQDPAAPRRITRLRHAPGLPGVVTRPKRDDRRPRNHARDDHGHEVIEVGAADRATAPTADPTDLRIGAHRDERELQKEERLPAGVVDVTAGRPSTTERATAQRAPLRDR